jgi:GntR family transcriptional regulator, hexuronate regulon transcriptional repressor
MPPAPPRPKKGAAAVAPEGPANDRLYQDIARRLFADLMGGKYAVGDRMPAERELSAAFGVSRPTVREAIIALEVQGLIEVRVGSGAYVKRLPGADDAPGFNITAFELTEARLLFEGEAAALAAQHITDAELDELDRLVRDISVENDRETVSEDADRAFHLAIARATRNAAVLRTIEDQWRLRATSPACAALYEKARTARVRPVVEEHSLIATALRSRDPERARAAMREHLAAVLDHLLFATEEQAIEEARKATAAARARFVRARTS